MTASAEPGGTRPAVAERQARARGRPRALGASGWRAGVAVALLAGAAGCASAPGDPFAAPPSSRGSGELHRVRFEVSCDACSVSWSLGPRSGGSRNSEALWSESVELRLAEGESATARLLAVPASGRAQVAWVRIRLDGAVVAEARSEGGGTGEVTVEARVP